MLRLRVKLMLGSDWTMCAYLFFFSFFFYRRASVKTGLSFSAVRPSDSALWDIVAEPGRGATVSVVCQRKVAITAKRSVHCARSVCAHRGKFVSFHQNLSDVLWLHLNNLYILSLPFSSLIDFSDFRSACCLPQ